MQLELIIDDMPEAALVSHDGPEEWRPIDGYVDYLVSSYGRVKSDRRGRPTLMATFENNNGYIHINLSNDSGPKSYTVHRLVAKAFCHKPEIGKRLVVNHKDGDRLNNKASNLEWITHSMNCKHAWAIK